ncbi:hypothetical protein FCL54_07370 [Pseudalkalibacillus caeni]|uniref:Uncharacterized protein n=1 Tax=Exobacillus caeni TaxID=2574798 RepID=A0A5R9F647_9BACL|nr:hypothetical protein FCL54_07370 [Pseudalkalibacillus caeni]
MKHLHHLSRHPGELKTNQSLQSFFLLIFMQMVEKIDFCSSLIKNIIRFGLLVCHVLVLQRRV